MFVEKRKNKRFYQMGRVYCTDVCVFPGVLLDISLEGCRVRFPAHVDIDMDLDYEMSIGFLEKTETCMVVLIAQPCWMNAPKGVAEIGFKFLHSPGTKKLESYINRLVENSTDEDIDNTMRDDITLSKVSYA